MADIEQITKIDLELSNKMSAFDVKLDMIVDQNNETNSHLKTLNGKVADHERRLSDYGAFKESVEKSAQKKARSAASIRSTLISIIVPIITIIALWIIERVFHFQLPSI